MKLFSRTTLESLVREFSTVDALTPDLGILKGREHHLLFEYGAPMFKQKPLSTAITVSRMAMWTKRKEEEYDPITAIALRSSHNVQRARVAGNIYLVKTNYLVALDNLRQNGVCFKRQRVPVFTPFLTKAGRLNQHVRGDDWCWLTRNEAWMYVGISPFWHEAMQWDLDYYRGHGLFRYADVGHFDNRQLQMPPAFKYTEPTESYKVRRTHHIRFFNDQFVVLEGDRNERDKAEREALLRPPTPPKQRRFISITTEEIDEFSE